MDNQARKIGNSQKSIAVTGIYAAAGKVKLSYDFLEVVNLGHAAATFQEGAFYSLCICLIIVGWHIVRLSLPVILTSLCRLDDGMEKIELLVEYGYKNTKYNIRKILISVAKKLRD